MKKCKLSIINSVIAGILICAMLAACGAAEKQSSEVTTAQTASGTVPAISDVTPSEPVTEAPQTLSPETAPAPETDAPTVTEPDITEPEVTEPEVTEPEVDVTAPDTDTSEAVSESLPSHIAQTIIDTAAAQLGVAFESGGSSPEKGFDASGLVYYCVKAAGIEFPRLVKDQIEAGEKIAYSDLSSGDIVYFSAEPGENASFCGIYVGGGLIIYAPKPGESVKTANITTGYWTSRFVTGIRPSLN